MLKLFKMVNIYNDQEVELIRESSLLVGKTLAEVAKHVKPGVETLKLDTIAEAFIRDHGAVPGFKGYGGFPYTLCISVNEVVVHGLPSKYVLQEGDIVSVDCGAIKNGMNGDVAYTFAVGEISPEKKQLMQVTKDALYKGIEMAVAGLRTGDIGNAVQTYSESFGYGVVRELIGHGVGRKLHEKPDVPNYGHKGSGSMLKDGMVIAIEPMITLGHHKIWMAKDGTVSTVDKRPAAHYEHDVVIRKGKADILSSYDEIEKVLALNN